MGEVEGCGTAFDINERKKDTLTLKKYGEKQANSGQRLNLLQFLRDTCFE